MPFALSAPVAGVVKLTPHGYFGAARPLRKGVHMGIDLAAAEGAPIYAAAAGRVARTGFDPPVSQGGGGGGNYVIESVDAGCTRYELGYMHLQHVDVTAGEQLDAGEQLGTAGASGTADGGAHLHFQVAIVGDPKRYVNPTADLGLGGSGGGLVALGAGLGLAWLLRYLLALTVLQPASSPARARAELEDLHQVDRDRVKRVESPNGEGSTCGRTINRLTA